MAHTYPGVYVIEAPSSVHTITAVPTAVAAFVGRARRGPVNTPVRIGSYGDFERAFGLMWTNSELGFAVQQYFLNGGADAYVVRVVDGALAASFAATPASITVVVPPGPGGILFAARSPGSWFQAVTVTIDQNTRKVGGVPLADEFNVQVTLSETDPVTLLTKVTTETFRNVSYQPSSARFVQSVINAESNLVRIDTAVPVTAPTPGTYAYAGPAVPDGTALAATDLVPADTTSRHGIYALDGAEIFTILYLPPYSPAESASPDLPLSGNAGAVNKYAGDHHAFVLWDPPSTTTPATFGTWAAAVAGGSVDLYRSNNSAMFYPWLDLADPLQGNRARKFGPSASVAGVMARIDGKRGVWKAPAGEEATVLGVNALEHVMSNYENGLINPLGVNAIRQFPIIGTVVWGARTLDGADIQASQFKYIPVKRLEDNIAESLFRGTRWAVFEPNDEPLWAAIRLNVGSFMRDLFRAGAFAGATPKDAYFVKCDDQTTTQSDRDHGVVNILVGFAPLKPAEFVVIYISQITAPAAA
jgi:phage tail sheath protein FI